MLVVRTVPTLERRRPEGTRQRTQDTKDQAYGIVGRFANQRVHFPARIQPATQRPVRDQLRAATTPSGPGTADGPARFPSRTPRQPPALSARPAMACISTLCASSGSSKASTAPMASTRALGRQAALGELGGRADEALLAAQLAQRLASDPLRRCPEGTGSRSGAGSSARTRCCTSGSSRCFATSSVEVS